MTANGTEGRGGPGVFRRRLLLAVDAQGYGRSDAVTQREFQAGLARLLDAAAGTAGLDRDRWETQRAGDSVFAVLPEGTDEPALVDTFMRALDAGLRAFNRNRVPHARLRLRAAVHFGPASPGPNGFADRAPVEIHRILDSAPCARPWRRHRTPAWPSPCRRPSSTTPWGPSTPPSRRRRSGRCGSSRRSTGATPGSGSPAPGRGSRHPCRTGRRPRNRARSGRSPHRPRTHRRRARDPYPCEGGRSGGGRHRDPRRPARRHRRG
ncbi:hypothetical protein ACFQ60_27275 [Streptomyces zhihengii]